MSTSKATSKATSLDRLKAALDANGWTYEVSEVLVKVPAESPRWRGDVDYVDGYRVKARNGSDRAPQSFTTEFTKDGKYLPANTKGGYPVHQRATLTEILAGVSEYSAEAIAERVARGDAEMEADRKAEEVAVAEAFEVAKAEEEDARDKVAKWMGESLGMTEAQVAWVLAAAAEDTSLLSAYVGKRLSRERVGRGWLPGKTSVWGTYVDGVKVSD